MLTAILDESESTGVMATNISYHPMVTLVGTSVGLGLEPDLIQLIQTLDLTLQTVQELQNKVEILEEKVETLEEVSAELPIGTIIETNTSITNLADLIGYGTWELFGRGRVTVCSGIGIDDNGTEQQFFVFSTGGEYSHELVDSELPEFIVKLREAGNHAPRNHGGGGTGYASGATRGFSEEDKQSNGGQSVKHNNVQPYVVVQRWVRTG